MKRLLLFKYLCVSLPLCPGVPKPSLAARSFISLLSAMLSKANVEYTIFERAAPFTKQSGYTLSGNQYFAYLFRIL